MFDTEGAIQGFTLIAPQHWRVAREVHLEAEKSCAGQALQMSWRVPSAICLYHASLECFINEELAIGTSDENKNAESYKKILLLQDEDYAGKLSSSLQWFGVHDAISTNIKEDAAFLGRIRNLLYHHSPRFMNINECPEVVSVLIARLGLPVINMAWDNYLSFISVLEWVRGVVEGFIEEFDRCVGRDKFTLNAWSLHIASPEEH